MKKCIELRNSEDILGGVLEALFYARSFVFTLQRLLLSCSFSPKFISQIRRSDGHSCPPMTLLTPPPLDVITTCFFSHSPLSLSLNSIFILFVGLGISIILEIAPNFAFFSGSWLAPRVTFTRSELLYFSFFCSRRMMRCLFRTPTSLKVLSPWKVLLLMLLILSYSSSFFFLSFLFVS